MRDIENPMLIDTLWKGHNEAQGLTNVVSQPEHFAIDFYGDEVLVDDEYAIDTEHCDEIILKKNLERYLTETCGFQFMVAD